MHHLISLDKLDRAAIEAILTRAQTILECGPKPDALTGRTVLNLFFEPSTRTRTSFELAARRLGATVVNFDTTRSSTCKGESLVDTLHTLEAMQVDALVVRHPDNGTPALLAGHAAADTHIINAGDGNGDHPTQGLLDALTIRQTHADLGDLKVVICGDIAHSRVARSDIHALTTLGVGEIELCGPEALLPSADQWPALARGADFDAAVAEADVIIMLRIQAERMASETLPDAAAYHRAWGLDARRLALAAPDCMVLHPGPINRGVEIAPDVADGPQSHILKQVRNGVAARMACLLELIQPNC